MMSDENNIVNIQVNQNNNKKMYSNNDTNNDVATEVGVYVLCMCVCMCTHEYINTWMYKSLESITVE